MFEMGLMLWMMGFLGVLVKGSNLIELLLCMEVMLSGLLLGFVSMSLEIDDMLGMMVTLMMLVLAAIESCVGLMALVSYYQVSNSVKVVNLRMLKG